jgi:hypothetical protein
VRVKEITQIALGICRKCNRKDKPEGGKTRIVMNFPTDCLHACHLSIRSQ